MTNDKPLASLLARVNQLIRQYNQVQEEATVESLRRFLLMVAFTIPMHFVLAWWFSRYPADLAHPEVMEWAHSLGVLHGTTGAIVLALACFVRWVVRPKGRATAAGVGLHILLCITYLVFGVFASQVDVKVAAAGGISPYIIVCITIGVTSLMRPAISIPMFAGALAIFWVGLSMTNFAPVVFASLVINSTAATVPALIASIMLWKQYVSISLLHQQLHNAQRALNAKQMELDWIVESSAQTQGTPLEPLL